MLIKLTLAILVLACYHLSYHCAYQKPIPSSDEADDSIDDIMKVQIGLGDKLSAKKSGKKIGVKRTKAPFLKDSEANTEYDDNVMQLKIPVKDTVPDVKKKKKVPKSAKEHHRKQKTKTLPDATTTKHKKSNLVVDRKSLIVTPKSNWRDVKLPKNGYTYGATANVDVNSVPQELLEIFKNNLL